jgi:hypothetical protein
LEVEGSIVSQVHHHTYRKIYQEPHLRFNSKYHLDREGRRRRGSELGALFVL